MGAGRPARIVSHCTGNESRPAIALGGKLQGTVQRIKQGTGLLWCKAEPITSTGVAIYIGHCVGQATCRMDDRQRTIAQCDQLPQAAWFERARHQKEIRASIDTVGERDIEANLYTYVAGTCSKIAEQLLITRVATAQDHKLQGQRAHFSSDLGNEIETLLIHEPSDDAYDC